MGTRSFTLFAAAALLGLSAQAAPKYRIERLPAVDGGEFNAVALNDRGQIAGYTESGTAPRGFVYDAKGFSFLSPAGSFSMPVDINEHGQVLFNAAAAGGLTQPFILGPRGSVNINPTAALPGVGRALSSSGLAVGDSGGRTFYFDGKSSQYLDLSLEGTRAVFATGINRQGVVVGRALTSGDASRGFIYSGGRATFIDGLVDAYAISDSALVLGLDAGGHVIRGADGRSTRLDFTAAPQITSQGWVVGSGLVDGELHAFVRGKHGHSVDLNDTLSAADAARWSLVSATDINERGRIVGMGLFDGVRSAFIATPVSEAQGWAMLLCGLGVVSAAARRRARR